MNPGREHERPGPSRPRSTRVAVDRPKNQHLDPDVDDVSENYRVLDEIGRGSFGVVYKAQDVKTKRYFAIKAVKECQGSSWSCLCKEGQILKTLQGHPNIVNLFCLLNADGDEQACPALVLEMCHCNLLDVLRNHREKIGIRHVKDLSLQLMEGLRHIHSCGIIHRDVKPSNILFTWNGDLKIADFGLATFMRASHGSKCYSPGVGTRNFKAPELLLGTTRYSRSVDMWAAGCTIVELMTNKCFFPGTSKQEILAQMVYLLGTINHTTLTMRLDLPLLQDFNLPQNDTIRMDDELSKYTSDVAAKNLVRALLQINPYSRLNASAAINHEFFICSPPPKRLVLFAADPLDQNNSGQDLLVPSGSDSSKGGVSQSIPTSAQTPLQDEPSVSSNYMSQRSTEQTNSEAGPLNQHSAGQDFLASSGSASSVRKVSRNISSSAQTLVQDKPQISSDYMSQRSTVQTSSEAGPLHQHSAGQDFLVSSGSASSVRKVSQNNSSSAQTPLQDEPQVSSHYMSQRSTVQTNSEAGPLDQHSAGQDFLASSGSANSVRRVSQNISSAAQTPLQDEQQISGHYLSQRSTHSLSTVQTNSKASPIDQHSSGQDFLVSSAARSVEGVSQKTLSSAQTSLQDEPPSSGHYMSQRSTHSLSTVLSNNEAEHASSPICISSERESAYSDTNLMLQDYLQDSRSAPDVIVISSDTDMDVQPQHVSHPSGFPPTARDDTTQPQPQAASHASGLLTAADINANQQQFQVFPPPGYPQLSIPHQQMSHLTQGGNIASHVTQPYQQCQCTVPGHLPAISVMLNHHPNYPYLQQCHNPQHAMQPGRSCQGPCCFNTIDQFPHPY